MVATRSSRRQSPAASETPSTNVTPLFSKANSVAVSADSDIELVEEKPALSRRSSRKAPATTKGKKRVAVSDSEEEAKPAPKRRALSKNARVEVRIPRTKPKPEVRDIYCEVKG